MIVVGVAGVIGAGKDVVAKYLVRAHKFQIIRFADALREEVMRTLPRTLRAYLHEYATSRLDMGLVGDEVAAVRHLLYEAKPPVIRALLQEWGTELRRAEDKDHWVRQVAARVADLPDSARVVLPDTRFPNEAAWVRWAGGFLVRVDRPGMGWGGGHASEAGLEADWDFVAANDGTIPGLEAKVEAWVRSWPS